jgi:branched-chain amino acid transport system permease protein
MNIEVAIVLGLLDGVILGFNIALVALGLSIVFGVMRIVNVSHGEFFMLGAVVAWYSVTLLNNFIIALIAAPLMVAGLAAVVDRFILRPINYNPENTIVVTIGLLFIIQQLVHIIYGPYSRPVTPPIYFRVDFPWFGYSGYKIIIAGISALLMVLTWFIIFKTKLGLYMRATQQDSEIAQAFAVPVRRVYVTALALGSALAAVAGVLIAPVQQAYYLMGLDALLISFMVVIIGGLGSLSGTLIAAFMVGVIDGIVSVFFSPTLARIVASLIVTLVLLLRPRGLFGAEAT